MITGKDLIALGYKPSKWFKEAIAHANKHELSGLAIEDYLQSVSPNIVEPYDKPLE